MARHEHRDNRSAQKSDNSHQRAKRKSAQPTHPMSARAAVAHARPKAHQKAAGEHRPGSELRRRRRFGREDIFITQVATEGDRASKTAFPGRAWERGEAEPGNEGNWKSPPFVGAVRHTETAPSGRQDAIASRNAYEKLTACR
jgi:hypothetical protein